MLVITLTTLVISCLVALGASASAIAIVARVAGSATITTASGMSHELGSVEPLQTGARLATALDSLAFVNLEQVGKVQLGPQTKTTVSSDKGWLSFQMTSGSLCVVSQSPKVSVSTGQLRFALATPMTIYDVLAEAGAVKIAVFRGGVVVGGPHLSTTTIYAGSAATVDRQGKLSETPLGTIINDFASLKCPAADVISQVMPTPMPSSGVSNGNHLGIILGTLLGLGAIAAAAGHGSGASARAGNVGPFGPVVPSASSVDIKVGGPAAPVVVSESGYGGSFTVATGCSGVAAISPPSGTSFSVSPTAVGNCRTTFSDDHGQSSPLFVFVTAGTMFVSPQTVQLSGAGNAQTFTVSDSSTTIFSATSSNLSVATVTLVASTPNAATFSVAGVASGRATIMVTDTLGGAANVSVGVGQMPLTRKRSMPVPPQPISSPLAQMTPPRKSYVPKPVPVMSQDTVSQLVQGPLLASTTSLNFSDIATSESLTVNERNYHGPISVMCNNPLVASAAVAGGAGESRSVVVTARGLGRAIIRITDDHGSQVLLIVTVLATRRFHAP